MDVDLISIDTGLFVKKLFRTEHRVLLSLTIKTVQFMTNETFLNTSYTCCFHSFAKFPLLKIIETIKVQRISDAIFYQDCNNENN